MGGRERYIFHKSAVAFHRRSRGRTMIKKGWRRRMRGAAAPPFRSAPAHVMRGSFKTYIIVDGRHSAERHAVHTHAHGA